jgi:hypothetical protein
MDKQPETTEKENKRISELRSLILNLTNLISLNEKEYLSFYEKRRDSYRSQTDFIDGLAYGLILGIIGNLFRKCKPCKV